MYQQRIVLSCALFICAIVVSVLLPERSRAEFYKYKDSSGALVITNKLEDVPKKYRKHVKVVWDDELTAKDPHARRMAAAEAQREQREKKQTEQKAKQGGPGMQQSNEGKTLVVTFDEETGQIIRRFE